RTNERAVEGKAEADACRPQRGRNSDHGGALRQSTVSEGTISGEERHRDEGDAQGFGDRGCDAALRIPSEDEAAARECVARHESQDEPENPAEGDQAKGG